MAVEAKELAEWLRRDLLRPILVQINPAKTISVWCSNCEWHESCKRCLRVGAWLRRVAEAHAEGGDDGEV